MMVRGRTRLPVLLAAVVVALATPAVKAYDDPTPYLNAISAVNHADLSVTNLQELVFYVLGSSTTKTSTPTTPSAAQSTTTSSKSSTTDAFVSTTAPDESTSTAQSATAMMSGSTEPETTTGEQVSTGSTETVSSVRQVPDRHRRRPRIPIALADSLKVAKEDPAAETSTEATASTGMTTESSTEATTSIETTTKSSTEATTSIETTTESSTEATTNIETTTTKPDLRSWDEKVKDSLLKIGNLTSDIGNGRLDDDEASRLETECLVLDDLVLQGINDTSLVLGISGETIRIIDSTLDVIEDTEEVIEAKIDEISDFIEQVMITIILLAVFLFVVLVGFITAIICICHRRKKKQRRGKLQVVAIEETPGRASFSQFGDNLEMGKDASVTARY